MRFTPAQQPIEPPEETSGGAFHPLNVAGCLLFLDSTLGITVDGSTNVSAWADQSGQGRHFLQTTDTRRPAYVAAGINGLPSISYEGTTKNLYSTVGVNILRNRLAASIFAVVNPASQDTGQTLFYTTTAVPNGRLSIATSATPSNLDLSGRRLDAEGSDTSTGANMWLLAPSVLTFISDYQNSNLYAYCNGINRISDTGWLTDGATSDTDGDRTVLGASSVGGSGQMLASISLFIVYGQAVSIPVRQAIERWCGRRYGITVA